MTDRQHRILLALRQGGLDQFQIASDLAEAPFSVRGDLSAMRRDRLVTMTIGRRSVLWDLTARGAEIAWSLEQLQLGGGGHA